MYILTPPRRLRIIYIHCTEIDEYKYGITYTPGIFVSAYTVLRIL